MLYINKCLLTIGSASVHSYISIEKHQSVTVDDNSKSNANALKDIPISLFSIMQGAWFQWQTVDQTQMPHSSSFYMQNSLI